MKHRYPTRITQLLQEINQVESAATEATIHQHCLMNINEQVKFTPQVIENCLKDNASILSQNIIQQDYPTNMANAIIDYDTGKELNYRQLSMHTKYQNIWKQYFANELGILYHGEGVIVYVTYTMLSIAQYQVPRKRLKDISYGRIVVDYRPQKDEPHRTRLTVGGGLIVYAGYSITPTADITT